MILIGTSAAEIVRAFTLSNAGVTVTVSAFVDTLNGGALSVSCAGVNAMTLTPPAPSGKTLIVSTAGLSEMLTEPGTVVTLSADAVMVAGVSVMTGVATTDTAVIVRVIGDRVTPGVTTTDTAVTVRVIGDRVTLIAPDVAVTETADTVCVIGVSVTDVGPGTAATDVADVVITAGVNVTDDDAVATDLTAPAHVFQASDVGHVQFHDELPVATLSAVAPALA